jgi:asparagine synthase (glutamine-hydrolysing)
VYPKASGARIDSSLDAANLALDLYEIKGETFVRDLNGNFALALWDSREQKFIVANDRYGLRPLYRARVGSAHLWASSPKAILAHPAFQIAGSRTVNLAALADLLCLNIPQGCDTIYAGIDEAPPASLAVWQGGQMRHNQYWDLHFQEQETGRPTQEYVAELVHLLRQAAQRMQVASSNTDTRKAGLLLSGGHDSRVILSALASVNKRAGSDAPTALTAYTFGVPECDDVRFARRAAETAGVRHQVLEIEADYLSKFALTGIKRTEDLISCAMFHGISVYDQAATHTHALITGSAGEDIFGHFCRDPHDEFWGEGFTVNRYYDSKRIMTDQDLKRLTTPDYFRQMQGLAKARFHQDMARYPSAVHTHQIDYWSIKQQQRRLYNRLPSLFPENLEFRPLYYDNDLIDFVQTLPPSMRWGEGSVYKQVLLSTAPGLARLPFTTTCGLGLAVSYQKIERRRAYRKRWRRWYRSAYRLSRGHLPSLPLPRTFKGNRLYADYDTWFRHDLRDWVESILMDPRTLDRGYWRAQRLRQMVQEHRQGRPITRQLATLISLELWHRSYLDQSHPGFFDDAETRAGLAQPAIKLTSQYPAADQSDRKEKVPPAGRTVLGEEAVSTANESDQGQPLVEWHAIGGDSSDC